MCDDSNSFWKTHERIHSATFGVVGGECVGAGSSGPRLAAGGSSYLESVGKDCGKKEYEVVSEEYEVRACGCRSWFCPHCCTGRGLKLRERLLPILQSFKGLLMWTFTIDPTLFKSPAQAFQYVRDKRCISETMRKLYRLGLLHSRYYICVIEWQKKSEMAHYHVLCDAPFMPFEVVCSIWNRFRPASAGPVQGDRPGFGSIRFSAPKFADTRHAANYACAYLIKYPEHGYPAWVEDSTSEIHRYSTSRGFWGDSHRKPVSKSSDADETEETPSDEDCCPVCGHEADGATDHCDSCGWSVLAEPTEPTELPDGPLVEPRLTIRQRREQCGCKSVLLRVRTLIDCESGEQLQRREFVGMLDASMPSVTEHLGDSAPSDMPRSMPVAKSDVPSLMRKFCRNMSTDR